MTMYKTRWAAVMAILGATVIYSLLTVGSAFGDKPDRPPKNDPPPPNQAPIRYQIKFFDALVGQQTLISDTNDWGQVVGYGGTPRFAWFYDSTGLIDLDSIPIYGMREGFRISTALGINNAQKIVGYIEPIGENGSGVRYGFVLDMSDPLGPSMTVFDNPVLGNDAYVRRINENGDILGTMRDSEGNWVPFFYVNDPNDGYVLAYPPGLVLDWYPRNLSDDPFPISVGKTSDGLSIVRFNPFGVLNVYTPDALRFTLNDIGPSGIVCGGLEVPYRKNRSEWIPMRLVDETLELLPEPERVLNDQSGAVSINDSSDFVTHRYLYHNAFGYLNIDDYIDPNDVHAAEWHGRAWRSFTKITRRQDLTGFPILVGEIRNADGYYRQFVLTPVPAP